MALVFEMNPPKHDGTPRAPAAREKLQQAEAVLAELEADVALLALEASEGKAGAEKALASQRSKIETAARSVSELTKAFALAARLDRQSDAASRAKIRESQLQAMKSYLGQRGAAMATMCAAAETMHTAYRKYLLATEKAVGVVPIGTVLPTMAFGKDGLQGIAMGDAGRLLTAEFYRLSVPDADGRRGVLPFSAPPTNAYRDLPGSIEPALDVIKAADAAIIQSIEQQLSKIEADEQATANSTAAELKEIA
jgi:hypothetical protein